MKNKVFNTILIILILSSTVVNLQAQSLVKNIKLKVFNNTNQSFTLKIYQQENTTEGSMKMFLTQAPVLNTENVLEILLPDINKNWYLSIYAELSNGGRSKTEYYRIDKNTKQIQVPIDIPGGNNLNYSTNFETIKEGMKLEPEKFRIYDNLSLADLFNGMFGGLVLYKDSSNNKVSIKQMISPIELGTRVDPKFGLYSDKKTLIISKEMGANAKLSIPSIAGASFDFSTADLFKLEVMYKGAGPIFWTPTSEMENVATKFKKLSRDKLLFLGELYDQDTTLKLAQIDYAYVYEAISFDLIKYNKLSVNSEISGSVYITSSGNYSTGNEETQKQIFGSFMLGAWWNNDYTPLLQYARKLYLEDKTKQITEQKSINEVKQIYDTLRESHPEWPEFTTKQKALNEIKKLNQTIKVNEFEIKTNIE